jgi:hypothetical protein
MRITNGSLPVDPRHCGEEWRLQGFSACSSPDDRPLPEIKLGCMGMTLQHSHILIPVVLAGNVLIEDSIGFDVHPLPIKLTKYRRLIAISPTDTVQHLNCVDKVTLHHETCVATMHGGHVRLECRC